MPRKSNLVLLAALVLGCSASRNESRRPPFVEAGDLEQIVRRGVLRILVPRARSSHLPSPTTPLETERELLRLFAQREGLEPFWVRVDSQSDLIPSLLAGKGDIVAANLTATEERREHVDFTVPVQLVREQVVTRRGDLTIHQPADLEGRRVAVRPSSSYRQTLERLRSSFPGIEVQELPESLDTDDVLHRVATRRLDVTIADSNLVEAALARRDDLRVACDLTEDMPLAWAVRRESPKLLRTLNRFLTEAQLTRRREELRTDDLSGIRKRKVLRLLTRNSAATYFLWRGRLMGFEYELAREFARSEGLRMEVVVPRRGEDLLALLAEGQGDLVASGLTPTDEARSYGVGFSRPYNFVSQVVVAPAGERNLQGPEDLAHRMIYARRSSPYWNTLSRLLEDGIPLILQAAPEQLETEELIGLVANGAYPLTVANSHILDIELTWRSGVTAAFPLGDPVPLAWAVRGSNPDLLAAVDDFLEREYRGATYNVLHRKYFEDSTKIRRHVRYRSRPGELSPYDRLVKRWAHEYDFDWRLIVAQIHHESGFDPRALSFSGAVGLLQVMPQTAELMGLGNLEDPETNIRAGLRYLSWVRERFDEDLPVRDRMWFSLAAYNVGLGHVRDARRLAAREGLDPDLWFDHVERAMLLLSRPEHARRAQYGYCRGSEPVQYVRDIRATYEAYLDTLAHQAVEEVVPGT